MVEGQAAEDRQAMTEDEIARLKGIGDDGPGKDDKAVKEIGSVDPVGDFKTMVNDRKTDRVGAAIS